MELMEVSEKYSKSPNTEATASKKAKWLFSTYTSEWPYRFGAGEKTSWKNQSKDGFISCIQLFLRSLEPYERCGLSH